MADQQNPSNRNTAFRLAATIAIIAIVPLLVFFAQQRIGILEPVTEGYEILYQSINPTQLLNILYALVEVFIVLVVTILSIALLFRIVIPSKTRENISEKWYWKYLFQHLIIGERRVWHILIGYFITILMLTPIAADAVDLYVGRGVIKAEPYYVALTAIPMLTVVLVATRILSKLRLKLIDTNIGVFIIAVLVAELIFSVSFGKAPLQQFIYLVQPDPAFARGSFVIYEVSLIGAILATSADWLIVTKVMKKEL